MNKRNSSFIFIDEQTDWASLLKPKKEVGSEAFFLSFTEPTDYKKIQKIQKELLELRKNDLICDTFLALEHKPVITQGRGLQKEVREKIGTLERNLNLSHPLPPGIEFCETERGGDLTYHGEGQFVLYPILKLDGRHFLSTTQDIPKYIRALEQLFIEVLLKLNLRALSKPGTSGVWVGEKKIASVGIAVQDFTTYHGIALNCVNSLSPFQVFSPCGLKSEIMTNLLELNPGFEEEWKYSPWRENFERLVFDQLQKKLGTYFLMTRGFCEFKSNEIFIDPRSNSH